jgi:hypothetical protein
MPVVTIHEGDFQTLAFPQGVDIRWETEIRVVWNAGEWKNEIVELVYEISWIKELGTWRRFLLSRRTIYS